MHTRTLFHVQVLAKKINQYKLNRMGKKPLKQNTENRSVCVDLYNNINQEIYDIV